MLDHDTVADCKTSYQDYPNGNERGIDRVLQDIIKPFGCWQFVVLMLGVWIDIPAAIFPIFGNAIPSKFRCQMEPHIQQMLLTNKTHISSYIPSSVFLPKGPEELIGYQYTFPFDVIATAIGPWGNQTKTPGCYRYKRDYERVNGTEDLFSVPGATQLEACPYGYVYESDEYQYPSGIVIEWDLVCEREWLAPLSTSLYMLGMVPGFWIGGFVADSKGRRFTALIFWAAQIIFGVSCSVAPNFMTFTILRFFLALASVASSSALLILPIELTIAKYRFIVTMSSCIVQSFFSRALTAMVAYFISYWRWVHLATIAPLVLGILQIWFLPESPRWLLANEKRDEAIAELYKGYLMNLRGWRFWRKPSGDILTAEAFKNKVSLTFDNLACIQESGASNNNSQTCFNCPLNSIWRPYRTGYLRRISFIATFLFTTQTACTFGVLLYARIIHNYVYLVAFLNNLTGIPGAMISSILYAKCRLRKRPLMITYLLTSLCFVLGGIYSWLNPQDNDLMLTLSSNFGLMLCTAINNMMLIYIPELYPSCIRSQGFGNAAGLGKIGGTVGTFVNQLDGHLIHGVPLVFYGLLIFLALIALTCLPDTTGENLPDFVIDDK